MLEYYSVREKKELCDTCNYVDESQKLLFWVKTIQTQRNMYYFIYMKFLEQITVGNGGRNQNSCSRRDRSWNRTLRSSLQ